MTKAYAETMETAKQKCLEVFGFKPKAKQIQGLINHLHIQKLEDLKRERIRVERRCIWL